MILTEEQKANINVLVSNEVEYHETQQEVYDHVLTSLEVMDAIPDLQLAYSNILEEDFGGHYGIEMLEESRRRIIRTETFQKQKQLLYWFFKLPALLFLIALCGIYVYWFEPNLRNITSLLSGGFILFTLVSFIVMGISNFILKQKNREQKPSINNVSIKIMWQIIRNSCVYLWLFRVLCSFVFIRMNTPYFDYHQVLIWVAGFVIDVTNLMLALYLVAGLVVYRNEFKKRLAI
jgi:hypothetical protein